MDIVDTSRDSNKFITPFRHYKQQNENVVNFKNSYNLQPARFKKLKILDVSF